LRNNGEEDLKELNYKIGNKYFESYKFFLSFFFRFGEIDKAPEAGSPWAEK
jgi:hypothetical protein